VAIGFLRLCLAATITVASLRAQSLADPREIAGIRNAFDSAGALQPLRCDIHPVQPSLNFQFRFGTGYVISMPLNQYRGSGHRLQVLARVTPDGREAAYLSQTAKLPDVPDTKLDGEFRGGFVVGEGEYDVALLVQDEAGRGCQSKWHIRAKRNGAERELRQMTPAGAVQELSDEMPATEGNSADFRIGRLTVLLHAAPLTPGHSTLDSTDVERLAGSLQSLLEQMSPQSVRVVVFNLEQGREMLRKESVTSAELPEIAEALNGAQMSKVDYQTLKNPTRSVDLIRQLLQKELQATVPPDAVIVLGPAAPLPTPVPAQWPERPAGNTLLFYFQNQAAERSAFAPSMPGLIPGPDSASARVPATATRVQPGMTVADTIDLLVRRWKGETLTVRTSQDFADAIRRVASRVPKPVSSSVAQQELREIAAAQEEPAQDPPERTEPERIERKGDQDPTEVLVRLRDQVLSHARRMPNYTCVETVERDRYGASGSLPTKSCDAVLARRKRVGPASLLRIESKDRLRLDVAYDRGKEIYSWAGASRFEEKDLDEWIPDGAIGTGPFAASLLSVFEPRTADFTFLGEINERGRRLMEYGFVVPVERSNYRVKAHQDWIITGYSGSLQVDPRTSELVRMTVFTEELPPATNACEVDTVLDYGLVQLGGDDYLLPKITRQRFIGLDGEEAENAITFSACREYRGESSIRFGEGADANRVSTEAPPASLELPAGQPVTVELTTGIRTAEAAAGDRIEGRLVSAVGTLPAGAKVEGRLMRVEKRYDARRSVVVVLRWERVEVAGSMREWSLIPRRTAAQKVVRGPFGTLQRRGTTIELPQAGEERYTEIHAAGDHAVVEAGTKTEWVTAQP
jgi:hypothetical protein